MGTVYLYIANERDLRALPQIGVQTAAKIIQMREKEPLTWSKLASISQVPLVTWESWDREGRVSLAQHPSQDEESISRDAQQSTVVNESADFQEHHGHRDLGDVDSAAMSSVHTTVPTSDTITHTGDDVSEGKSPPGSSDEQEQITEDGSSAAKPSTRMDPDHRSDHRTHMSPDHRNNRSPSHFFDDYSTKSFRPIIPSAGEQASSMTAAFSLGDSARSDDSNGLDINQLSHRAMNLGIDNDRQIKELRQQASSFEANISNRMDRTLNQYRQDAIDHFAQMDDIWHSRQRSWDEFQDTLQRMGEDISRKNRQDWETVRQSMKARDQRMKDEISSLTNFITGSEDRHKKDLDNVKADLTQQMDLLKLSSREQFKRMDQKLDDLRNSMRRRDASSSLTGSPMSAKDTINKSYRNLGLSTLNAAATAFKPVVRNTEGSEDGEEELERLQVDRDHPSNQPPSSQLPADRDTPSNQPPSSRDTPEDFHDITRRLPSDRIYRPSDANRVIPESGDKPESQPVQYSGASGMQADQLIERTEVKERSRTSFGFPLALSYSDTRQFATEEEESLAWDHHPDEAKLLSNHYRPREEVGAPEIERRTETTHARRMQEESTGFQYRGSPNGVQPQHTRGATEVKQATSKPPATAKPGSTPARGEMECLRPPGEMGRQPQPDPGFYTKVKKGRKSDQTFTCGLPRPQHLRPPEEFGSRMSASTPRHGDPQSGPWEPGATDRMDPMTHQMSHHPVDGMRHPTPGKMPMLPPGNPQPQVIVPGGWQGHPTGNVQYTQCPVVGYPPINTNGCYPQSFQPVAYAGGQMAYQRPYEDLGVDAASLQYPRDDRERQFQHASLKRTPFQTVAAGHRPRRQPAPQLPPRQEDSDDSGSSDDSSDPGSGQVSYRVPRDNPPRSQYGGSRSGSGRGERIKLPSPKMPQFNGTVGEWDNFFFQFEAVCDYYQMGRQEKLQQLKNCLTSKAVNFVRTLSPRCVDSYRRLCARLKDRFGGVERPEVLRTSFHDLKQRVDETLDEFADRVQTQANQAYPGQDQAFLDMMSTNGFMRGVRDRLPVLEAAKTNPQTVRQALTAMKNHSALVKAILGKSSPRQVSFAEDQPVVRQTVVYRQPPSPPRTSTESKAIQAGTASVKDRYLSPTQPSPSVTRSPPRSPNRRNRPAHDRCYNCDQTGHYRADCPQPPASPKANGRQ